MPANDALRKSGTVAELKDEWSTPRPDFALAERLFGPFDLDAAATAANTLCPHWLGPGSPLGEDALAVAWVLPGGEAANVWLNPPYSKASKFVVKAHDEARRGRCAATLLVNSATEVRWFHRLVFDLRTTLLTGTFTLRQGVLYLPLYRRIRFIDPATGKPSKGSGPAGSALVHFTRGLAPVNPLVTRDVFPAIRDLNLAMAEIDAEEEAAVARFEEEVASAEKADLALAGG